MGRPGGPVKEIRDCPANQSSKAVLAEFPDRGGFRCYTVQPNPNIAPFPGRIAIRRGGA